MALFEKKDSDDTEYQATLAEERAAFAGTSEVGKALLEARGGGQEGQPKTRRKRADAGKSHKKVSGDEESKAEFVKLMAVETFEGFVRLPATIGAAVTGRACFGALEDAAVRSAGTQCQIAARYWLPEVDMKWLSLACAGLGVFACYVPVMRAWSEELKAEARAAQEE